MKKLYPIICIKCGVEFSVGRTRSKVAKFCSQLCMGNYQKGKPTGRALKRIKKICIGCKKSFKAIITFKKRYCSRNCVNKYKDVSGKNNSHWQGGKIQIICQVCNKKFKVFPGRKKTALYCSVICQVKGKTPKISGENNYKWIERVEIKCLHCNKSIKVIKTNKDKKKFCSKSCTSKWQ